MNRSSKYIASVLFLALCVIPAAPALSQGNEWGIDPDIDGDGSVTILDVQQVVNSTLGVNEAGRDATLLPIRQYVVAAPRASLVMLPPPPEVEPAVGTETPECLTVGAACNFPRRHGRLLVRPNTVVVFRLAKDAEGVWYQGACGLLGTQLILSMLDPSIDPSTVTETGEVPEDAWIELGRDAAAGLRCGPRVGHAVVGVRHLFQEPGDYLLKAAVWTGAIPGNSIDLADPGLVLPPCSALVHDVILIGVRVLPPGVEPEDIPTEDVNWEEVPEHPTEPFAGQLQNGDFNIQRFLAND